MYRPLCPDCKREMIFVCVVLRGSGECHLGWQCDCLYRGKNSDLAPRDLVEFIVRAREDDETSITYEWGSVVDTEPPPWGTIS